MTGARDKLLRNVRVGVNIKREMLLSPNDEEVVSSEKHTQFKTRVVEIDTLFQTKTAKKPYPLAMYIPIWPIQGSTPFG